MKVLKVIFLSPLSLLWFLISSVKNLLYESNLIPSKSFEPSIKTICIGNLSVGGTGKTPHTEYIYKLLENNLKSSQNIALLSRGYKRKTKGFVLSDINSTLKEIGDEPLQFKLRHPNTTVAVHENRVKGIEQLIEQTDQNNVILLDDAFQHRRLTAGLSILLTRKDNLYTNDWILPLGTLREPASGSKRADIIIVTGGQTTISPIEKRLIKEKLKPMPMQDVYFSHILYKSIIPMHTGIFKHSLNKKTSVVLVTGIAHHEHLFYHVKLNSKSMVHLHFPDHHNFTAPDVEKIKQTYDKLYAKDKIILTTEKDAVRIKQLQITHSLLNLPLYYIPIEIGFDQSDSENLNQQIINYVKSN